MNTCRTCLKTPADKHISELEKDLNEGNINYLEIMVFCLDIKVTQDSKITNNLCKNCFRKIILFYKFKVLSLKNDAYLKSVNTVETEDQKLTVYLDENGIKHENFLDSDDFGPLVTEEFNAEYKIGIDADKFRSSVIEDCSTECKIDINIKDEALPDEEIDGINLDTRENVDSDEEPLSIVQKVKNENNGERTKKRAPKRKKSDNPKKAKPQKKAKVKCERQICEECGKSFWNLKEHLHQHRPQSERKKLQCQACPKLFLNAGDRKRHYRTTHLGLKKKCVICNKEVTRLAVHVARHDPATLRFPCVECARRFLTQAELDAHVVSHTNNYEYSHECEICQKKFSRKALIRRHIRQVHEKERKHQCELCPKAFFTSTALREHSETHSTQRLYECSECGLALKTKATLKCHLTTHTDVKSYHCEHCSKIFRTSGLLCLHMVTHTKEKRYPCGFCGARFGRSDHRNRHELTAHKKHSQTEQDIKSKTE